jgi:hypothetical protein
LLSHLKKGIIRLCESKYSSKIFQPSAGNLCLREQIYNRIYSGSNSCGALQQMPSLLHGGTKIRRQCFQNPEIQAKAGHSQTISDQKSQKARRTESQRQRPQDSSRNAHGNKVDRQKIIEGRW